jgi:hypothetical protein
MYWVFRCYFLLLIMDYDKVLIQRYKAIRERSFKTKLEMFLFERGINEVLTEIEEEEFERFKINEELVKIYQKAWQIKEGKINGYKVTVEALDKYIEMWNNEKQQQKQSLKEKYILKFSEEVLSLEDFKSIFTEKERVCYYCNTSEITINELRLNGKINTKNGRGGSEFLQIDRRNSNKEYVRDNIVLCCYWCNNAKTDEFTEQEFIGYIGPGIKKIWEKRISNILI